MDDNNISISDSWSVENDVRSEESISHNSRDYTPEFTTDQIFESREGMLTWAQSVGLKYDQLESALEVSPHIVSYCNTQFTVPPIPDCYIQQLPQAYQCYISHTVDVLGDGHCGFRAIAAQIGYGENGWIRVREELIEEIEQNLDLYSVIYPVNDWANNLLILLNWFGHTAPKEHWMEAMTLGIVIATRYNLVLHTFDEDVYCCFTHLPLRSPPIPLEYRQEIAIARVNNDHFVQVFLEPHYPIPPIPIWWERNASNEAIGWAASYGARLQLWYEVMGISPPGAAFGGDID